MAREKGARHMTDPELLRRLFLLQSFFDRTSTLERECAEGAIPAARFAVRVHELALDYDKALRKEADEPPTTSGR